MSWELGSAQRWACRQVLYQDFSVRLSWLVLPGSSHSCERAVCSPGCLC